MVTAPNFNQAAVQGIFDQIVSLCMQVGRFDSVNTHEVINAPGNGITAAVWVDSIKPVRSSGLQATSGALNLRIRLYMNFRQQPFDMIDPDVITGVSELMAALSGDFDFGQLYNVRGIDLLGGLGSGENLQARAGYLEMDRKIYRIMTIWVPVVVNDMWTQAG